MGRGERGEEKNLKKFVTKMFFFTLIGRGQR